MKRELAFIIVVAMVAAIGIQHVSAINTLYYDWVGMNSVSPVTGMYGRVVLFDVQGDWLWGSCYYSNFETIGYPNDVLKACEIGLIGYATYNWGTVSLGVYATVFTSPNTRVTKLVDIGTDYLGTEIQLCFGKADRDSTVWNFYYNLGYGWQMFWQYDFGVNWCGQVVQAELEVDQNIYYNNNYDVHCQDGVIYQLDYWSWYPAYWNAYDNGIPNTDIDYYDNSWWSWFD